jgi:hypothetical protein
MNDEFLYQYRRPPRPEFARALYARISAKPRAGRQPLISLSFSPLRQMAKSVTIMAATFLVVCAISPKARKQVVEIRKGKVMQWQTSWL